MRKVLDYDPGTKTTEYIHLNGTGNAVIESIQDVEPSIKFNQMMAGHFNKKDERWFVGNIPNHLCVKWAAECGAKVFTKEWVAYAKTKLQDRDFSKLNQNGIKF